MTDHRDPTGWPAPSDPRRPAKLNTTGTSNGPARETGADEDPPWFDDGFVSYQPDSDEIPWDRPAEGAWPEPEPDFGQWNDAPADKRPVSAPRAPTFPMPAARFGQQAPAAPPPAPMYPADSAARHAAPTSPAYPAPTPAPYSTHAAPPFAPQPAPYAAAGDPVYAPPASFSPPAAMAPPTDGHPAVEPRWQPTAPDSPSWTPPTWPEPNFAPPPIFAEFAALEPVTSVAPDSGFTAESDSADPYDEFAPLADDLAFAPVAQPVETETETEMEPIYVVAEPMWEAAEPIDESVEPMAAEVADLVLDVAEPTVDVAEPTVDVAEPTVDVAEPTVEVAEPTWPAADPAGTEPMAWPTLWPAPRQASASVFGDSFGVAPEPEVEPQTVAPIGSAEPSTEDGPPVPTTFAQQPWVSVGRTTTPWATPRTEDQAGPASTAAATHTPLESPAPAEMGAARPPEPTAPSRPSWSARPPAAPAPIQPPSVPMPAPGGSLTPPPPPATTLWPEPTADARAPSPAHIQPVPGVLARHAARMPAPKVPAAMSTSPAIPVTPASAAVDERPMTPPADPTRAALAETSDDQWFLAPPVESHTATDLAEPTDEDEPSTMSTIFWTVMAGVLVVALVLAFLQFLTGVFRG